MRRRFSTDPSTAAFAATAAQAFRPGSLDDGRRGWGLGGPGRGRGFLDLDPRVALATLCKSFDAPESTLPRRFQDDLWKLMGPEHVVWPPTVTPRQAKRQTRGRLDAQHLTSTSDTSFFVVAVKEQGRSAKCDEVPRLS